VVAAAVVTAKAEKTKKALTSGKLYQLAFPTGPGSDASLAAGGPSVDDLPRLERAVYDRLASLAWDLTQAGRSGYIQRYLERMDSSLVLCRVTIHMPRDKAMAAYVTDMRPSSGRTRSIGRSRRCSSGCAAFAATWT